MIRSAPIEPRSSWRIRAQDVAVKLSALPVAPQLERVRQGLSVLQCETRSECRTNFGYLIG